VRAWSRQCEAQKIIDYLKKWILSEQGKNFSFGIITFYRKQVDLIKNLIKKEFTKEERESFSTRLKIGTVDSFQGMEFDIVFLSVVRSRNIKTINDKLKDYNLFGFLISKNRLCVSMSRQKKSLIVVGDRKFFEHERAKNDVEQLHNFLQLCKNKGRVL
jgi:superfamily I DNA and/or RNA helicase